MTLPAAPKLCKTQGKLPQRDATLVLPTPPPPPLPLHLLIPHFSACRKSKCVPQLRLPVVGVSLETNSISSAGRFASVLQREKNGELVPEFIFLLSTPKSKHVAAQERRWSCGIFSNVSLFCLESDYRRRLDGSKAAFTAIRCDFPLQTIFSEEQMAPNWILLQYPPPSRPSCSPFQKVCNLSAAR